MLELWTKKNGSESWTVHGLKANSRIAYRYSRRVKGGKNLFCLLLAKLHGIFIVYIHTYIICPYNPSVRIIDVVSHTNYVVWVNFIHKCWNLLFKVDSERQIFWETCSWQFYFTLRVLPEICWEEIAEKILF